MAAEIDWEFAKLFHPMALSERRLVLKELGRDDVVHRDEEQFYTWLAERYRLGEGQVIDAAIRKASNKGDERGIEAKLYQWIIQCTDPTSRRRSRNKQIEIRTSSRELLQRGGENAALLTKLAANYPWLELGEEWGAASDRGDRDSFAVVAAPNGSVAEGKLRSRSVEQTLSRLAAAIEVLRANPIDELLIHADALVDAVEAHSASAERARREAEALAKRREALSDMLARLDEQTMQSLGDLQVGGLALDTVEMVIKAIADIEESAANLAQAQDDLSNSVRASREEREAASEELNRAEDAHKRAIAQLGERVSTARAQLGVSGDDGPASPELESKADPLFEPLDEDGIATDATSANPSEETPEIVGAGNTPVGDPSAAELSDSGAIETVILADDVEMPVIQDVDDEPPLEEAAPASPWDAWIATALEAGRFGLAVHLADGRKLAGAETSSNVAHVVFEALLRGSAVQAAYNRTWAAYEEIRAPLMDCLLANDGGAKSRDLLLLAGALRPAMLQSDAALAILNAIEGDAAAAVAPLVRSVEKVASLRLANFADIAATPDLQEKQRRAADIKERLASWFSAAPTRKMNYQPATAVWQDLVMPTGAVGKAVQLALTGKGDTVAQVRNLVTELEEDEDGAIDGSHIGLYRGAKRDLIEGVARKQLKALIRSATELLHEWIAVKEEQGRTDDPNRSHRDGLLASIAQARASLLDGFGGAETAAAASAFVHVLSTLEAQLRGAPATIPYPEETLDWEIALLAHFPLNARTSFRVLADDVEDLANAAAKIDQSVLSSVEAAFALALSLSAVSSAKRLQGRLGAPAAEGAPAQVEAVTATARTEVETRRSAIRQSLDDLQIAVVASDRVVDELESAMTSFEQLNIVELPLDIGAAGTIADFPSANRELDRIGQALERVRAPYRRELEERIAALEIKYGHSLADCRAQLNRGDLGTLAEEVDQIESHGPAEAAEAVPLSLLGKFAQTLKAASDKPAVPLGNLPKAARDGAKLGGFDFSSLPTYDRDRAAKLIEAWNALRRSADAHLKRNEKKDPAQKVGELTADLLEALGFAGTKLTHAKREANWYNCSIATVPLSRREDCPVPALGSERVNDRDRFAHYPVIVAGQGDANACIASFDKLPNQAILLFTDTLDVRQRRDLQKRARRNARTVAVADSLTIVTLAATKEARTRQFFELAIPFGNAQPYADTGSETAIENFFGRENELRELVNPRGPCFVYGGRQLGKTALLKQIELREKNNDDRVAVYCYIKPYGQTEGADQVWAKILRELEERGVALPRAATVQERLKAWVRQKPGRYLLIMLDEADAFLAGEMNTNFPIIEQMKALMEDTGRDIKFVFAGLHNVQRFYRAPNSPLLHMGMPINVGPLLGSDRHAARQMALEPMAALGFEFENNIDAYHMLSLIGFYPSLMQIFGKDVVAAMNAELVKTNSTDMPIVIKRELIDRCFNQKAFRASIVERLQNTLKLDERYELITYAVWTRMQEDSSGGRSTAYGYTASEISQLARDWWPAGFAETESLESFTAILDEMDGMGVLARRGDRYALRSQRIAAMLGGKDEIHAQMQDLIDREPRRRPDPLASHRRIDTKWSPLTLRQEAALGQMLSDPASARIILIGGAQAAGIDDVGAAIESLADVPNAVVAKPRRLRSSNYSTIADVAAKEKPKLLVVEGAWPSVAELDALRRDRAFRDSQRPVRLVIAGRPTAEILALPPSRDVMAIQVGPLSTEALGHWMVRAEYADDDRLQENLRKAGGSWLGYLEEAWSGLPTRKRTPEALVAAVAERAAAATPAELGLDADSLEFTQRLFEQQGVEAADAADFAILASIISEDKGEAMLRLIEALGIIETVPEKGEVARQAFHPTVARLFG